MDPINGNSENTTILFINGIATSEEVAVKNAELLAEHFAAPVELIYNPPSKNWGYFSIPVDAARGVAALLSHQAGAIVEQDTILRLGGAIRDAYQRGEKISIYAHSQGALILRDTLELIRDKWLSQGREHEWNKLTERLSIYTYGIDVDNWPDVATSEVTNRFDPIYQVTALINACINLFARSSTDAAPDSPMVNDRLIAHSFASYLLSQK